MLMTRAALAAAGFVQHEIGGTVYFESVIPSVSEGPGRVGQPGALPPAQVPRSARDDRRTLVLVHGVNDHAGSWFLVAPALAKKYRVIIPDLPGHGESEPKQGPLPISLMVQKLAAVIGDQRVTLVGNSLGGWLSMLYTLAHPQNVSRLILEASGGLALPLDSPTTAHTRDEAMIILRNVHGPRFEPQEWVIDALLQRAVSSPMLRVTEVAEHLVDARLKDIRVPTAVLWGADDGVVPRAYAEALQQGIAGSTMHVIEGAAHIPHLQQPERFLQCLTSIS
jgi:pimeloyl-ACP methyl ester carboxylesterase